MNKTFKGKLADGEELRIRLSTNDGLTGYKIIKFQLFPVNYNVTDEYNSRVYSVAGKTNNTTFDFNDPQLLVAAYFENSNGVDPVSKDAVVVIDNKIINQDIFVQHKSQSANACNFYMELEQVKLDINEATIATLKDMRGRE
jgi:hypothetical protein